MSEASGKGGRVYVCMTLEKLAVRKGEERREAATFVYGMHPPHLLPALLPPAPALPLGVRVIHAVQGKGEHQQENEPWDAALRQEIIFFSEIIFFQRHYIFQQEDEPWPLGRRPTTQESTFYDKRTRSNCLPHVIHAVQGKGEQERKMRPIECVLLL